MANEIIFTMTGVGGNSEYTPFNKIFEAISPYGHFTSGDEIDGTFELYDNSRFVLKSPLFAGEEAKCISSVVHIVNGQFAPSPGYGASLVFEGFTYYGGEPYPTIYVYDGQIWNSEGDTFINDTTATIERVEIDGEKFLNQDGVGAIRDWVNGGISALQSQIGSLPALTTDNKDNLVNAINEVYEKSGEPFRVKNWANSFNVEIPTCTEDIGNTAIPKMTFSIDAVEGADYQIVGMIAYEVFDAASGGNRLNVWPVCQFTGNGQKELSVRWVCGGTTRKTAKRINAWVLLKHR